MKKTLLYIAVFASFVLPSITFAAWYNPLSWFKKDTSAIVVPVSVPVNASAKIEEKSVPKPVITNTITVTDPKIQSQINELAKSNTDLQIQLASLTGQYNDLLKENSVLKIQLANMSSHKEILDTNSVQEVKVSIYTPIKIPGFQNSYRVSFPLDITNTSDKPASISSISYVFKGITVGQSNVAETTDDTSRSISSKDLYIFTLLNPIVLKPNYTTTIYINTNYQGVVASDTLHIYKIQSNNPNVNFTF